MSTPRVGETYELDHGVILTVVEVGHGWHGWPSRRVPRIGLMVIVCPAGLYWPGKIIHETIPTGDLQSYGYTRLA